MKKLLLILVSIPLMAAAAGPVSLVQNEYDFAAAVAKHGQRDGFLMYLDKQAMTLAPKPVNDYDAHLKAKPDAPGARLTWFPVWALVSASGDFGVDTGPWTYEAVGKDGKPEKYYGDWFTVWARNKDGQWKALFDGGVDHAAPASPVRALAHDTAVPQLKALDGPAPAASVSQDELVSAEELFSKTAMDFGLRATYQKMGADDLRLMQEGQATVAGKAAAIAAVVPRPIHQVWIPFGGSVAHSGDLAYLYGMTYAPEDAHTQQKPLGSFMHVWQRSASGWKLLVAEDTPFAPGK